MDTGNSVNLGSGSPFESASPISSVPSHDKISWKAIAIVAAVVAIIGISLSIFLIVDRGQANDKIASLESEMKALQEQLDQEKADVPDTTPDTSQEEPPSSPTKHPVQSGSAASRQYLQPDGWNVRFAYPEGVTNVEYGTNDTLWDGTLYVVGITKNGKTYNVDLFGGKDSYHHYPFFFSEIARWNSANPHGSWSGVIVEMDLLFTNGNYQYYAWDKGNGYESGKASDYDEACQIVKELFSNIEAA